MTDLLYAWLAEQILHKISQFPDLLGELSVCEQCVPGFCSPPTHKSLGTRLVSGPGMRLGGDPKSGKGGDFNIDLLVTNQLSNELTAMISSFHFTQVVEPARLSKNSVSLIDHVYLTDSYSLYLVPHPCPLVILTTGQLCYLLTGPNVHPSSQDLKLF